MMNCSNVMKLLAILVAISIVNADDSSDENRINLSPAIPWKNFYDDTSGVPQNTILAKAVDDDFSDTEVEVPQESNEVEEKEYKTSIVDYYFYPGSVAPSNQVFKRSGVTINTPNFVKLSKSTATGTFAEVMGALRSDVFVIVDEDLEGIAAGKIPASTVVKSEHDVETQTITTDLASKMKKLFKGGKKATIEEAQAVVDGSYGKNSYVSSISSRASGDLSADKIAAISSVVKDIAAKITELGKPKKGDRFRRLQTQQDVINSTQVYIRILIRLQESGVLTAQEASRLIACITSYAFFAPLPGC